MSLLWYSKIYFFTLRYLGEIKTQQWVYEKNILLFIFIYNS